MTVSPDGVVTHFKTIYYYITKRHTNEAKFNKFIDYIWLFVGKLGNLSFDGVGPDGVVPHLPGLLGGHLGLLGLVQPPPEGAGLLGPQVGGLVLLSLMLKIISSKSFVFVIFVSKYVSNMLYWYDWKLCCKNCKNKFKSF